jgi:uncharacterized protein (TIGR02145 family)
MAENLRTEKFRNGDPIEQITSNRYWADISLSAMNDTTFEEIFPVMCYMNNNKGKDNALYNWYTVIDSREICPFGWHVPSPEEFEELLEYLGGIDNAITRLKSTMSWKEKGINSSGFNALGIGYRVGSGEFAGITIQTGFWTDGIIEHRNKYNNGLSLMANVLILGANEIDMRGNIFNVGNSIRCIKN